MTVHTPIRTDDVRRSYARWAGHYDFTFALFGRKYIKQVVKRLNLEIHGHKVLDVGTGTGLSLPYFAPYVKVTGIDLSADMLARAHRRVMRHKLENISALLEMDAANMNFENSHFYSVLATFVMSVVPNPSCCAERNCPRHTARRQNLSVQSFSRRSRLAAFPCHAGTQHCPGLAQNRLSFRFLPLAFSARR